MEISRIKIQQNQNFGAKLSQDVKTLLYEQGNDYMSSYDDSAEEIRDTVKMLKNISPNGTIELKDEFIYEYDTNGNDKFTPSKTIYLNEGENLPLQRIADFTLDEVDDARSFFKNLRNEIENFEETNEDLLDILG